MKDLAHFFGNDLSVSPTGDLMPIDGTVKVQQRLLRRLLTNPGDYIWHPDYGAGLPQYIGKTLDVGAITAVIRGQLAKESAIMQNPEPLITITAISNGVACKIQYVDATTSGTQVLSFEVTP